MSHHKERLKPRDFSSIDIGKGTLSVQINNRENSSRSCLQSHERVTLNYPE